MAGAEQVRNSIRNIAAQSIQTRVCKVLEVDAVKNTCKVDPIDAKGASIPGVRLKAIIDAKPGIIPIPTVGSTVLVSIINNDPEFAFVSKYSEIDSYQISLKGGNTTLEMTAEGITLNGGAYGGLIKIEALVNKINAIEQELSDLTADYKQHTHGFSTATVTGTAPPGTGGGPITAGKVTGETDPPAPAYTDTQLSTTVEDLENNKITHG